MKIKYEDKYIAFIDVLGFSNLVESEKTEKLEEYFNLLDTAFKIFENSNNQLARLAISDSIILVVPDADENFKTLLSAIRTLQEAFAVKDIWVRGGITFGPIYYDKEKNNIVGKGFIKAYQLEKEAIYPRVIIDPSIIKRMKLTKREFYEKYNGPTIGPSKLKLIHDYGFYNRIRYTQDDAIFVCYANSLIIHGLTQKRFTSEESWVNDVYNNIRNNLYGEQKHYSKYLWLKRYFHEALLEQNSYATERNDGDKDFLEKACAKFLAL